MRLTNRVRDEILSRVISFAFDEKFKVIDKELKDLAEETYAILYPKDVLDRMAQLEPFDFDRDGHYISKDYFHSDNSIYVAFGYKQDLVCFNKRKPIASKRKHRLDLDHPMTIKHEGVSHRRDDLVTERNQLKREIRAILYSVSTFKKLYDVWPEVSKFTADIEVNVAMQLPAVKVDSINQKIGLTHE